MNPQREQIDRNYDAFVRQLSELLPEHRNEHALMRDGHVIDFFSKPGEAWRGAVTLCRRTILDSGSYRRADRPRAVVACRSEFADPHLVVGPLDGKDRAIVPTSSDLYGVYADGGFGIEEVREKGHAAAKGVRPGMIVTRVEGRTPRAAVEEITGRPFSALSPPQIDFAFNTALAGVRRQPRALTVAGPGGWRRFELAATVDQALRVEAGPPLTVERHAGLGVIRINNSLGRAELIDGFSKALVALEDCEAPLVDFATRPAAATPASPAACSAISSTRTGPIRCTSCPLWRGCSGRRASFSNMSLLLGGAGAARSILPAAAGPAAWAKG